MTPLKSQFRAQLQPETWISDHFRDAPPQRENFRRRDVNFLRLKKIGRQSRAAKQRWNRDLLRCKSLGPTFSNSKSISHNFCLTLSLSMGCMKRPLLSHPK